MTGDPAARVVIRSGGPADAERIAEINVRSWRVAYEGIGSSRAIDFDGTDVDETRYRAEPVATARRDGAHR